MYKFSVALLITLLCSKAFCATDNSGNSHTILQNADKFRLQNSEAKIVSKVQLFKENKLNKTQLYHVYVRPGRESLVIFKATAEAGQKMLMLEDNYWLLMPKSRRPIRITPMQKLLGEASVGDIATLTWSQDYRGTIVGEQQFNGQPAIKLKLEAKTSGASYHSIDLLVAKADHFPLQAQLYLKSGKKAKTATFTKGVLNGQQAVTSMQLMDAIEQNQLTIIDYQTITPWQLADKFYNPGYLSRQNTQQL